MTLMTLMTAMTMNCRGSLNRMGHSPEMGGSMRSTSATKSDVDVKLGVPTSSRTSSAARVEFPIPLYLEEWVFIHTPHPRSDPQDLGERQCSTGRDVHDGSSRIFGYLTDCLHTIFSKVGIVFQKDHRDEMVDAKAGSRSKTGRENPL
jgi:hypothetical protein